MSSTSSSLRPAFLCNNNGGLYRQNFVFPAKFRVKRRSYSTAAISAKQVQNPLQYRKLGDSELHISEITLGTMTFGEQNTEKEAHEILNYAFENGINALDTAEAYPIPLKKETQGRTDCYIGSWLQSQPRDKVILATKVCGYSERSTYMRENATVLRVDAANIKESVEKSLKRLNTDYIDLLQIHWSVSYHLNAVMNKVKPVIQIIRFSVWKAVKLHVSPSMHD